MNRQLCAAPRTVERWQDIDFAAAERSVKKLQMRIAKAVKQGYSISKSHKWLQEQRQRLSNRQIKRSYFSQMFTAIEQFNQLNFWGVL